METVAAVFRTHEAASDAVRDLRAAGFKNINLLAPGDSAAQLSKVPTSETEQPGMGRAIGGVVGAALGIAGGLELGTAVAAATIPGIGPVVAIGIAAAALLGTGGGIGGADSGAALEEKSTAGLPADEIYVYKDALRQGRFVVFVPVTGDEETKGVRRIFSIRGAEALEPAREDESVGLHDAAQERY